MSWKPICESIISISKINLRTEDLRCLFIVDDSDGTYVLIGGNQKYQWFLVKPGTLKLLDLQLCEMKDKMISRNTSFIGELSKLIAVPTDSTQREIMAACK